jgi:hypothetical protein
MARGLPVSPMQLLLHSQGMLQTHCAVCCEFSSGLVFISELLSVCSFQYHSNSLYVCTSLKHPSHMGHTQSPAAFPLCLDN